MRAALLFLVLAAAVGCERPDQDAIAACETFVKEQLRSPSLYKRIKADAFLADGKEEGWVSVEYDAANVYGTPIRERQTCRFPAPGGKWAAAVDMEYWAQQSVSAGNGLCCGDGGGSAADNAEAMADAAMEEADRALNEAYPAPAR